MQVEHKTKKGTVLFVKVPDDANNFIQKSNGEIRFDGDLDSNLFAILYDWQLIGLTSEVTEDQAKMMVEFTGGPWNAYKDFTAHNNWFASALWSFKSLMQHLQVYEVNPFVCKSPEEFHHKQVNQDHYNLWKEAESRTGKWIVLFKPNEK